MILVPNYRMVALTIAANMHPSTVDDLLDDANQIIEWIECHMDEDEFEVVFEPESVGGH